MKKKAMSQYQRCRFRKTAFWPSPRRDWHTLTGNSEVADFRKDSSGHFLSIPDEDILGCWIDASGCMVVDTVNPVVWSGSEYCYRDRSGKIW